ncbi:1-phosphofructokinase family hexose kinase, partial [Georgenia subflava]
MIRTVTPNPAVDVTYTLPSVRLGEVNRVREVAEAAGGKGVNVARVLAKLGRPVTVTGFLGGATGERLSALLATTDGVAQEWLEVAAETRRTTTVVDTHGATVLNEPGPRLAEDAWVALADHLASLVRAGDVVVVAGSTPPGTGADELPRLLRRLHESGARTVVDTSGPGLLAAAAAGAHLLKPNHHELLEATGATDVRTGAELLLGHGAGGVAVSSGEEGMLLVLPDPAGARVWRARPAEVLSGNPTGAGDAAVAALADALAAGT